MMNIKPLAIMAQFPNGFAFDDNIEKNERA